ncbi:MAG: DUF2184 domain-containing protein [Rickettsiales bacterium]|jgi:hypothetical protein|nr:DUF2184 domain-containing protein [Rickettsiales bacterium]
MYNRQGYLQVLTTLTGLDQKYSEQQYYKVDLTQYIDFEIGEEPFRESLLKSRELKTKKISYGFVDLEKLRVTQNFDLVEARLESRKKSWDLMIRDRVFLGSRRNPRIRGLLNLEGIAVDTSTLTAELSALAPADVQGVVVKMVALARRINNGTATPNTLIIPEDDYIRCSQSNEQSNEPNFQLKTRLGYLQECFELATVGLGRAGGFRILPNAFADSDIGGPNKGKYLLYSRDMDTMVFDIPIPFTTKSFVTSDQMNWESVALGQVGAVRLFRPAEVVQFINLNA